MNAMRRPAWLLWIALTGCVGTAESLDAGLTDAGVDSGVPSDASVDAGLDGGGFDDAGLPDAGIADGGGDAGSADAGSDAGLPDAGVDAGEPMDASVGAAFIAQRTYAAQPATGVLTTSPVQTHAGATVLVSLARGTWSAAPDAPTDSFGNAYTLLGQHAYTLYPTSATGLYQRVSAAGGAGHTFSMSWGDIGGTGDEVTLSGVEVLGVSTVEADSWVERAPANSLTSGTVHVDGPALLVAWWWGSGGVRTPGTAHVAVPGSGFQLVPGATGLISLSSNGYIQVACASRWVTSAGDYQVTWTTDSEGAQLYLVALRAR